MILAIWILTVLIIILSGIVKILEENTFISDLFCYIIVLFVAVLLVLNLIYFTPKIFL